MRIQLKPMPWAALARNEALLLHSRRYLPSYTVTDLLLRWQAAARTSLALRAFNVFDKRYYDTAYYTPTQWLAGPSRRVELVLDQRF